MHCSYALLVGGRAPPGGQASPNLLHMRIHISMCVIPLHIRVLFALLLCVSCSYCWHLVSLLGSPSPDIQHSEPCQCAMMPVCNDDEETYCRIQVTNEARARLRTDHGWEMFQDPATGETWWWNKKKRQFVGHHFISMFGDRPSQESS